ncbi:nitrile hydratase subunit alpha [SAR202 cluster bacterium AC-409-J13_OGT_754m]|nr:nitrile hydratase subunit alpha [SAR202 cluster bacterium AC-409-J13_OGT_754m]
MYDNLEDHVSHSHQEPHFDSPDTSSFEKQVEGLKQTLLSKGLITQVELEEMIAELDQRTPFDGAQIIARAWTERDFRNRLIANGTKAVSELGYHPPDDFQSLVVLANTEFLHHLIVCTLCSCYPRWLLGRPPDWYKSIAYRSRAVSDPRGILNEFGVTLDPNISIRVVDSTAEVRYMVLPLRPSGTDNLNMKELVGLITRDSLIGVGLPHSPSVG